MIRRFPSGTHKSTIAATSVKVTLVKIREVKLEKGNYCLERIAIIAKIAQIIIAEY